jgi:ERCC4-type nuclease
LGDFLVDGRLLVERKSLTDLMLSIQTGRLFEQSCRLAASPLKTAVVLEGTAQDLIASGMRRESVQGAMITLTLIFGLPVLRSMGPKETARLMLYAARQMRRVAVGAFPHKGARPKGKLRTQYRILEELPGVGPRRAHRLLERFGTVEAVFSATREELAEVDGVGDHTAKAIRWAVGESPAPYSARKSLQRSSPEPQLGRTAKCKMKT